MTNFYNNLPRKVLLSLFIVFISMAGYCATYYVSNSGSDSNSGLSISTPWKTVAKVNSSTFMPGDQILFQRGGTWREKLIVPSSGSSSARIVFSNYGTGANPRILGSSQATAWTNQGGNIWKASTSLARPWDNSTNATANVYFIKPDLSVGTGVLKSSTASLTSQYDWYWASNALYVYCTTNPGTAYTSVEVAQRNYCVAMAERSYIEFNGINTLYSTEAGYHDGQNAPTVPQTGVVVRNSETAYHGYPDKGGYGVALTASNSVIEYNKIHDCGRRGTSTHLIAGFTLENVTIQNNTFYNMYHTASVDLAVVTNYTGSIRNVYIRNNLVEASPSYNPSSVPMTMHIANDGTGSMSNIYINNNVIKYQEAGIYFRHIQGALIYNNTFYGHTETSTSSSSITIERSTNIKSKNNIFYSQLTSTSSIMGRAYYLASGQSHTDIESDYNIFYRTAKSLTLIKRDNPLVDWGMDDSTAIRSNFGWEMHSRFVDPKVKSSADLTLQSTSKAINAGVNVGLTKDFNGNPIVGLPDIGAYESGSTVTNTTDITVPIVSNFVIPATTTSFTVPVSSFTATDNIGVTGYMLTTTSTAPTSGATGWSPTKPTSYVFSSVGSKTLYAWAKDAAGNVSAPRSASTIITIPTASTFTLTGPSSGNVNSTSANFTVTPNNSYTGTITITFTGTGSTGISTKVLTFSNSSASQTFTITPTVAGSITLTPSNNSSLSNPSSLTYTVNGNVSYLGNKVKGSSPHSIAAGDINASQFTASSSFTATTMFISIAPFTGKIKGAIYSDNAGSLGTKLGETIELTNPTISGFQQLTGLNVPIIQGRKYWLVLWSNAVYKIDSESSGGILKWKSFGTYGSWPYSLILDRTASLKYSIYVTGGLKSASIENVATATIDKEDLSGLVNIDVFPNPSKGKITVRFSTLPEVGSEIEICDISGRQITSRIITGTSEEFNLEDEPAGLYLVKSTLGSNKIIQKLIINK